MPPKGHARLGGSNAHQWMQCPGSVRMQKDKPNVSTEYSIEGTAAHTLLERCLEKGVDAALFLGEMIGTVEVTEDMAPAVQVALDYLRAQPYIAKWSELPVDLAPLDPPEPMHGTADWVGVLEGGTVLEVVDYKHGRGYAVPVIGNTQTRYYAGGAYLMLDAALRKGIERVRMTIIQPRAPHPDGDVRSEEISVVELAEFLGEMKRMAVVSQQPDAPLVAGDHCRFCRAKATCPAQARQAMDVAAVEFIDDVVVLPSPSELPMDRILNVLGNADAITSWINSIRQLVLSKLERGEEVPGYKLVPKRATRKWVDEQMVTTFLHEQGYGVQEIFKTTLKSPAQIEKLVGKMGLPQDLWKKESSGNTLAPMYDSRPAVNAGPDADFGDDSRS